MNYQSTDHNQRPKGFKVTRAFQFTLLLAVCVWFLYQIKHLHNKGKEYGGNVQSKLGGEHGVVLLGRKGNAGLLRNGDMFDLDDEAEGKLIDVSGGDDELDGNEFVSGDFETHEGKNVGKEPETQLKKSLMSNGNNSGVEERQIDEAEGLYKDTSTEKYPQKGNYDERGNEKDLERKISPNEQGYDNNTKTQVNHDQHGNDTDPDRQGEGEAVDFNKENDEDKNYRETKQGIEMLPIEMNNATVFSQSEMEDEVYGFQDENGVPHDTDDPLEFMLTYSRDEE